MDDLADEAIGGLTAEQKADLTKEIEALCPQGDLITMGIELILDGELPPARVTYYAGKFGKGLDILARKYGYENVLMEYSLELTMGFFAWNCMQEMDAFGEKNKKEKVEKEGKKIPLNLEGEAEAAIQSEARTRKVVE